MWLTLGFMVCEYSKKDGEIIKIRIFMTKDELPVDKQNLWQESTILSFKVEVSIVFENLLAGSDNSSCVIT